MAFGEIKANLREIESKLKIFHKHLGNMLGELETVCSKCGSSHTEIIEIRADNQKSHTIRECKSCGTRECL